MSVKESQTFGKTRPMFEGYGGPVNINPEDHDHAAGIDPTLESCCQREIESNRKQTALESTLRRHDRVALAERRRRNVIPDLDGCRCCYDKLDGGEYGALADLRAIQEAQKDENDNHGDNYNHHDTEEKERVDDSDDDSDDDSEFDYLLDEDLPGGDTMNHELQLLQQERMEELKLSAMMRESARQHGFGVHRQFDPQRILHAAGLGLEGNNQRSQSRQRSGPAAIPPAAVIHLYQNSTLSASLDLCLEEMAENSYRGTKFLRSEGRTSLAFNRDLVPKVLPSLKIDSCLPALIAVKDGVVISICENLSLFVAGSSAHYSNTKDDEKVEARAVEEWLDRAGVLLHEVPVAYEEYCRIRPEEDALLENMMREKAKLDSIVTEKEIYQCGVPGCQKVFHHEHVGVKNEQQSGLILCQEITGE